MKIDTNVIVPHPARFILVVLASLSFLGCGGSARSESDPESDFRPWVTREPVPYRPENDARTDPDAPCTTGMPVATGFCSMPEEESNLELVGQGSTTTNGCTSLYLATRVPGNPVARVRRYNMTGVDVCGFARDPSFAEVTGTMSAIAAADDGTVFTLGDHVVRRVHPGPVVDCEARDVTLGAPAKLVVTPDGTRGYLAWDLSTTDPQFAKLTATESGCELTPLHLAETTFNSGDYAGSIATDREGRLHVALARNIYSSNTDQEDILIFDAEGKKVGTYERPTIARAQQRRGPLVPCFTGTCIELSNRGLAMFRTDGELRVVTPPRPVDTDFYALGYAGSVGGPVLRVGVGEQRTWLRIQVNGRQ